MPDDGTIVKDVLKAKDAKTFVGHVNVTYDKTSFKDLIFTSDPDDFLLITKRIGSRIAIADVKVIDDAFMASMF